MLDSLLPSGPVFKETTSIPSSRLIKTVSSTKVARLPRLTRPQINLIDPLPKYANRCISDGLDIHISILKRDILIRSRSLRVVDFAHVDARGPDGGLLPVFGDVAGAFELFVEIDRAVVCGC